MWSEKVCVIALLLFGFSRAQNATTGQKLFCYYDGSFSQREDAGKGFFRDITSLKTRFLDLKVFLSVGGNHKLREKQTSQKYLRLLESEDARKAFVASAYALLKTYNFDGLDLAWQFPQTKPKRIRAWPGQVWNGIKKIFTDESVLDPKANDHREQFTALVRDLKNAFAQDQFQLMFTQLPHVNQTIFLDIPLLKDSLDYVNVAVYDQQTPERNPKEGDYYAPIYRPSERASGNSLDEMVNAWSSQGTPLNKIVVGIAAYGRGWKLVEESGTTGVPPIRADGPSAPAAYTDTPGFYSFSEVCFRIRNLPVPTKDFKGERPLTKVEDPTKRFGPYAYRFPAYNQIGIWLSYENPDSVGYKAAYVKAKGLAGISINDLALDDYRGLYYDQKFPIVRAVKDNL
uniref:Uncharacterized protein n=1 Tax=Anopheles atroparvus TaxID=41427 RepID=A0A182ITS1_ANOAO